MEHEVYHEYKNAKSKICDDQLNLCKSADENDIVFHPVYLSSVLNQMVFQRDVENNFEK